MALIIGKEQVLRNLNKEIQKIEGRSKAGLLKAGMIVRRDAQEHVPVDTGNLKASAYTMVYEKGKLIITEIGFTASYAPFVHEAFGKLKGLPRPKGRGFYWDPQGKAEPQFLRNALLRNVEKILEVIKQNARIK